MTDFITYIDAGAIVALLMPHIGKWRLSRAAWSTIADISVMSVGVALFSAVGTAGGLLLAVAMGG